MDELMSVVYRHNTTPLHTVGETDVPHFQTQVDPICRFRCQEYENACRTFHIVGKRVKRRRSILGVAY